MIPAGSFTDWGAGVVGGIVGGAAGAIATVYFTGWRAQRRAPKLSLSPGAQIVPVSARRHVTNFPSLWIHLVAQNKGKETAEDVEVRVHRVRLPGGERLDMPRRPLKWSEVDLERRSLPPNTPRDVDLGHVLWPPNPVNHYAPSWPPTAAERRRGALVLALYPRDADDSRAVLDPGTYEIELAIAARGLPEHYYHATVTMRTRHDLWDHAEDPEALAPTTEDGALVEDESSLLALEGPSPGRLLN